jgi:hypothetical protein
VRYWQLGEDEWREAESWPPPHTEQRWYLHSGGGANSRHGDGTLTPARAFGDEPADSYRYDPLDPVPTVGGKTLMPTIMTAGIEDQSAVEARKDILCFTSPTLTSAVAVHGPVTVELWAASSAVDTDFTAKLVDVYPPSPDYPNGVDLNIGDSIVRARYRQGLGKATLLTPGQPAEFTIEMYPTSLVFRQGHRIRLDISSSNFPRFDVNPNTGEPLNDQRRTQIAENSVFHDPARASHILLPIIPAGATTSQQPRD